MIDVASAAVTTLFVILLFVKVFVELIVGIATLPIVAQVVKSGDILLTSPPVPVEVAPQRVFTMSPTVVSSRTVLAAAVIVAVSGTPVEAVVLPINWSCARLAILARVTALLAIVREFVLFAVPSKLEPALVTSPVAVPIVLPVARVVAVPAFPVTLPVIALVTSKSVNQPFVTRVAVAPIVVTKRLAHFFNVVPKSSVLSVSDTRVVFIATEARLDRAVLAPPLAGASRAREPSAWTVRTSPSLPPEKFISSALAMIVQEAMSQGWRAESANAPCAVVATAISPLPRRVVEFIVLIFVPDTRVACFVSRPVFKRFTVGYFVVLVSIVVFSLFATFSGV